MYLCIYYRTSWSRLLLKKLVLIQLIKKIPNILRNLKIHSCVQKSRSMAPVQGHANPVYTVILLLSHFNNLLPLKHLLFLVVLSLRSLSPSFCDFLRVLIKIVWPPSSMSNRKQRFGRWICCFPQVDIQWLNELLQTSPYVSQKDGNSPSLRIFVFSWNIRSLTSSGSTKL